MTIVYCRGHFVPEEEAVVPIDDRGFLFGDALFTTVKVVDGHIRCLEAHLRRLNDQALGINLELPIIDSSLIHELILRNRAETGTWRLKIIATSASASTLGLPQRPIGSLIMTLEPYRKPVSAGVHLALYPDPICRPSARVKSLAYLDRLYVRKYAEEQGCEDALVTGAGGEILETAFSNFFWCIKNRMFTPSSELPLMSGIALQYVRQAANSLEIPVKEVSTAWEELPEDALCFTCNALTDICSVACIGNRICPRNLAFEDALKTTYETIVRKA